MPVITGVVDGATHRSQFRNKLLPSFEGPRQINRVATGYVANGVYSSDVNENGFVGTTAEGHTGLEKHVRAGLAGQLAFKG